MLWYTHEVNGTQRAIIVHQIEPWLDLLVGRLVTGMVLLPGQSLLNTYWSTLGLSSSIFVFHAGSVWIKHLLEASKSIARHDAFWTQTDWQLDSVTTVGSQIPSRASWEEYRVHVKLHSDAAKREINVTLEIINGPQTSISQNICYI